MSLTLTVGIACSILVSQADSPPDLSEEQLRARHQTFVEVTLAGEKAVHQVLLGNKYNLQELYDEGVKGSAASTKRLLENFGDWPPGKPAWKEHISVEGWRDGMALLQRDVDLFQSGLPPKIIVARVARMWDFDLHIEPFSGYPAGTFALLEAMADIYLARDLDPAFRSRIAAELNNHFRTDMTTFRRLRRPMIPPAERDAFDESVRKLVDEVTAAIRARGPISDETLATVEKQFVTFGVQRVPGLDDENDSVKDSGSR